MSYSATGPDRSDAAASRRQNALGMLLVMLVLISFIVRVYVSNDLMNQVMEYTTEFGSFYEKIHLGTYLILLATPIALLSRAFYLEGADVVRFKVLVRYGLVVIALIVFELILRRMSAVGMFVDTYLVAAAAGLILLAMAPPARRLVGDVILLLNMLSATLGMVEFATKTRLMPYHLDELVFRPTGLSGHPLDLGMISGASLAFIPLTTWKPWVKVLAMLVLLVGTATAGARFALVMTVLAVLALVLFVPWNMQPRTERKAKLGVLVLVLAGGVGLLGLLAAGGALDRFEGGIVDENFFARTDIYSIFSYVSWQQIAFGTDLEAILKIVNTKIGLPYIESAPVYLTFLLGAPVALFVFALLFWMFWRLLRGMPRPAWIGIGVFLAAALSNNTLSTKTPVVALFVILILAYSAGTARTSR